MREQDRNLAAFGLGPFRQRFVFVHPYAIALGSRGAPFRGQHSLRPAPSKMNFATVAVSPAKIADGVLALFQLSKKGASPRESCGVVCSEWRMTTVTHCCQRKVDL